MQAHLEKLQVQISECEMIRDLATDKNKRELFTKLAEHFRILASHVEQAIVAADTSVGLDTLLGRKNYEPFTKEEE